MMLHARRVVVPISKNNPAIVVEAPPPEPMAASMAHLGFDAPSAAATD